MDFSSGPEPRPLAHPGARGLHYCCGEAGSTVFAPAFCQKRREKSGPFAPQMRYNFDRSSFFTQILPRKEPTMELSPGKVRALRLHAHHLDRPLPAAGLADAAGTCGMQNSPPGAWETAAFNRAEDCSVCSLHTALYHDKTLLQAWSWRGVPAIFPAEDAGVFLAPLFPHPGEEPWIYTRGIGLALDLLGMTADDLLPLVLDAARLRGRRGGRAHPPVPPLLRPRPAWGLCRLAGGLPRPGGPAVERPAPGGAGHRHGGGQGPPDAGRRPGRGGGPARGRR